MVLRWHVELIMKHKTHNLAFKSFTKWSQNSFSPSPTAPQCMPVLNWKDTITQLQQNPWTFIYLFAKVSTVWLESLLMWTLGWEDKIDFIAFKLANLVNCFKGTCWQWVRNKWNLAKSGKKRGPREREEGLCMHFPTEYRLMQIIFVEAILL